jgi:general secretion pathway protein K
VLLLEFNYETRVNVHAADNFRASRQSLNCARAGLNVAVAALSGGSNPYADKKLRDLLQGRVHLPMDDGQCTITVTEENGKINVNLLTDSRGKLDRTRVDQMLRLIDLVNRQAGGRSPIGYGLVPALIDWTDADDDVTYLPFISNQNTGVESSYYQSLPAPYHCHNSHCATVAELTLIKGITPPLLWGDANDSGAATTPLADCLTVYGDGKIDVNHAPAPVIESLSEQITPIVAQMVVEQRQIHPYATIEELAEIPGLASPALQDLGRIVTVEPQQRFYQVRVSATVGPAVSTIRAVLKRDANNNKVEVLLYQES